MGKIFKLIKVSSMTIVFLVFLVSTIHAETDLKSIVHVYVDDIHIGAVNNQELVESFIEEQIAVEQENYEGLALTINEKVTYVPETAFKPTYNNDAVLNEIKKHLTYSVKAVQLEINDVLVGNFKDEQQVQEVLTMIKAQYVPEEYLEQFETTFSDESLLLKKFNKDVLTEDEVILLLKVNNLLKKTEKEEIEEQTLLTDENLEIVEVDVSEEWSIQEVKTTPDELLTIEEAISRIEKGKVETKTHQVTDGETLESILEKYEITEEQLLEHNPELKENFVLDVEQELIIPVYKSLLSVVVTERTSESREIEFTTEYVESDEIYKGHEKVKEKGQPGEMKVIYEVVKVNGKEVEKNIVDEEIVKEPVQEIIAKGTKPVPAKSTTGSGKLAWPTAGGIITSYMGPRWSGYHNGIDISGVSNKTIYAAEAGVVELASFQNNGYGNRIVINHGNGLKTTYSHLSSIYVTVGQTVTRGEAIGVMGRTGNSTGVHLHFEVSANGSYVNPMSYY